MPPTPILSAFAALAAVLALVLLAGRAARAIRRRGIRLPGAPRATRLSLQDSLPLDRARQVHLIRCDDRDLLILTGHGPDLVLGWLPPPPAGAAP